MQKVWGKISIGAQCCTNYLEEELPEVLATWLPGLGNGSVNGSTRSKVVEAREQLQKSSTKYWKQCEAEERKGCLGMETAGQSQLSRAPVLASARNKAC